MRLLKLDSQIQDLLIKGMISSGHARALLSLEDGQLQKKAAQEILDRGLSVRETEKLVKKMGKDLSPKEEKAEKRDDALTLIFGSWKSG